MERFVYPAQTTSDEKDGGFVVQFVDFPEAVTQGDDIVEAGAAASDCLEEVIANRIMMGLPIPKPSRIKKGQFHVVLSAQIAAKAALYLSLQKTKITKMELARREREPILRGDLAVALLRELDRACRLAGDDEGFDGIRREWGRLSSTLGKRVALQIGPHRLEGHAQALDEDGSLLVRCDNGRIEHAVSGDVIMEK